MTDSGKIKMLLTAFAAIYGGLSMIAKGLGDEPIYEGGTWKGAIVMVLGVVLIGVTLRSIIREEPQANDLP